MPLCVCFGGAGVRRVSGNRHLDRNAFPDSVHQCGIQQSSMANLDFSPAVLPDLHLPWSGFTLDSQQSLSLHARAVTTRALSASTSTSPAMSSDFCLLPVPGRHSWTGSGMSPASPAQQEIARPADLSGHELP